MPWGFFGTIDAGRRLAVSDGLLAQLLSVQPVPTRVLFALPPIDVTASRRPGAVQEKAVAWSGAPTGMACGGLSLSAPVVHLSSADVPSVGDVLLRLLDEVSQFAAASGGQASAGVVLALRLPPPGDDDVAVAAAQRRLQSMLAVIMRSVAAHVLLLCDSADRAMSLAVQALAEVPEFKGKLTPYAIGDEAVVAAEAAAAANVATTVAAASHGSVVGDAPASEPTAAGVPTSAVPQGEGTAQPPRAVAVQDTYPATAAGQAAMPEVAVSTQQAQTTSMPAAENAAPTHLPDAAAPPSPSAAHVTLSILPHLPAVLAAIHASPSRCLILDGPTGCGKSTQVPMALVQANAACRLWVTQPRRTASVALANRCNEASGGRVEAAYAVGGRSTEQRTSRIVFMTPGVLLKRVKTAFRNATFLNDLSVTHILLDEVHERTVETDVLCCLLRELLKYNMTLRVVMMSATLSCTEMCAYMHRGIAAPRSAGAWVRTPLPAAGQQQPSSSTASLTDADAAAAAAAASAVVPIFSIPQHDGHRDVHYIEDLYHCVNTHLLPAEVLQLRLEGAVFPTGARRCSVEFQDVLEGPRSDDAEPPASRGSKPGGSTMGRTGAVSSSVSVPAGAYLTDGRRKLLLDLVAFIHASYPAEQSILIFVSGLAMIERLEAELPARCAAASRDDGDSAAVRADIAIITLHSASDTDRSMRDVFDDGASSSQQRRRPEAAAAYPNNDDDDDSSSSPPVRRPVRRIIVATNIAESSLTIPHVDHVIDTCLVKDQLYSYEDQMPHLVERFASQDSCVQRAGRTGRLRKGTVWRLCTAGEYSRFDPGRTPGMLQASLLSTILLVADADVGELDDFIAALPTPPPAQFVQSSLASLRDHYHAVSFGTPDLPFVSLTTRGVVLAALGLDVPLAHLVLLGVSVRMLMPAVQAAAILSSVGSLVRDDGMVHLIDFDNATSCDVLALVQLYRAWVRHHTATHLLVHDAAVWTHVRAMVRPHAALDIRDKTLELIRQLDQFGLASQYYAGLLEQQQMHVRAPPLLPAAVEMPPSPSSLSSPLSPCADGSSAGGGDYPASRPLPDERLLLAASKCWEESCDVSPLSGPDTLTFVALLSLAFVRNTLTTQQTPAQSRAVKKYGGCRTPRDAPFVPYHEVTVRHTLPPTALELEELQAWLLPCVTSVLKGDGDLKSNVRFRIERIVRFCGNGSVGAFGQQQTALLDDEFTCRVVRGALSYDAYKLLKMGREDCRRLNVAFADCPNETHLMSAWFVEGRAPYFLDRGSMLYPLVADVRNLLCPSLVACRAQKRKRHVAVQQVSLLPGGLSFFPLIAALLVHWDGCTLEGHSAVIRSLPHCHPDVKKIERYGVDLGRVVVLNGQLRDFYAASFDELMAQRSYSAAGSGGVASDSLFALAAQKQLWLAKREGTSQLNRELLDLLLCCYLRDLPDYFAPNAVRECKQLYKNRLPMQLWMQLGQRNTAAGSELPMSSGDLSPVAPALLRLAADEAGRASLASELERLLSLGDPAGMVQRKEGGTAVGVPGQPSGAAASGEHEAQQRQQYALPAVHRLNELITSEMLRSFRSMSSLAQQQQPPFASAAGGPPNVANGSTRASSLHHHDHPEDSSMGHFFGVPLRSFAASDASTAASSRDAAAAAAGPSMAGQASGTAAVPLSPPPLRFLRCYAQRYMTDQTVRTSLSLYVWPALGRLKGRVAAAASRRPQSPHRPVAFIEPLAETSGGLLAFWASNTSPWGRADGARAAAAARMPGDGNNGNSDDDTATPTRADDQPIPPDCMAFVAMCSTSVGYSALQSNMAELARYSRLSATAGAADSTGGDYSSAQFPLVDVWARRDGDGYAPNSLRDVTHAAYRVVLGYLPAAADARPSRGPSSSSGFVAPAGVAERDPPLEADEHELLTYLRATAAGMRPDSDASVKAGDDDGDGQRVLLVLWVHRSRYAAVKPQLSPALLQRQPLVERFVHDALVGDVVLLVSALREQ